MNRLNISLIGILIQVIGLVILAFYEQFIIGMIFICIGFIIWWIQIKHRSEEILNLQEKS
jgi:hypothetical protein